MGCLMGGSWRATKIEPVCAGCGALALARILARVSGIIVESIPSSVAFEVIKLDFLQVYDNMVREDLRDSQGGD